ncbi:kinase phosphorylation protein-domain-containing protein [Cryomyces antarcticus]
MDLLQTVRKEGSRGGRAAFSWDDVRTDAQRENYLGHSLMAPVGRWQKGKDLGWYAKGDDKEGAKSAEELRREEIRRIKEAEEDALAAALGLPVPDRASRNANLEPLGKGDVIKAVTEVAAEDEEVEGGRGVGFGGFGGAEGAVGEVEVMRGYGVGGSAPSNEKKHAEGTRDRERRRSRSRDRAKKGRNHEAVEGHRRRRSRSRNRDGDRRQRSRSEERRRHRSRSRDYKRHDHRRERRQELDRLRSRSRRREDRRDTRRSRSPHERADSRRYHRHRRDDD